MRALVVCACLGLMGCQEAFDVALASGATVDNLSFTIVERDRPGARPRYHTVKLYDADRQLVWHLRAAPFGTEASQASLRFGAPPPGFEAVVAAPELTRGREYALIVSGGPHGQLRFRVDAEGGVRRLD